MPDKHHIVHPFPATYDADSEILILGSFPSVKSREMMYFYGHPQNRFWKVVAALYDEPVPETVDERRRFLLKNHIAVWDVIGECDIIGSADSTIENAVPNDLTGILETAHIRKIFVNGRKAEEMFIRYQERLTGRKAVCLPSTSPANAAWSLERLAQAWSVIKEKGMPEVDKR
ncbi:MAG: DNA-deoxyinosine glycosylase [Lachnospiraceae bacterium]|nr:DNA-deoxyinosine glycosylase [Lachnospiraceae bacterium]